MRILKKVGMESGNEVEVVLDFQPDEAPFRVIKAVGDTWSIAVYCDGYLKAALTEISLDQLRQLLHQIVVSVGDEPTDDRAGVEGDGI